VQGTVAAVLWDDNLPCPIKSLLQLVFVNAASPSRDSYALLVEALNCIGLAVKNLRRQIGDKGALLSATSVIQAFSVVSVADLVRSREGVVLMSKWVFFHFFRRENEGLTMFALKES